MVLLNKRLLAKLLMESASAVTAATLWADDVIRFHWRDREDVMKVYPNAKFLAGSMATFPLGSEGCSVTVQIAFNTGVVIILATSANNKLIEVRL